MWNLLNSTWTLIERCALYTKIEIFGNKHTRWVWSKKKDEFEEKHLMPIVKYCMLKPSQSPHLNPIERTCVVS